MAAIKVSLDINAIPPIPAVTVDPPSHSVNHGNKDTIRWIESKSSPDKGFTFTSLAFAGNPTCFKDLKVCSNQITVDDDNTGPAEYPYTIVVTYGGKQYQSVPVLITDTVGGPGDPKIHNN